MSIDPANRLPSLNALRAFEAVARLGSLTRAAAELHVTTAAVSHQIKALEEDLGIKLLHREGREISPSEAAEPALAPLREGFDLLHQAVHNIRSRPASRTLNLTLAEELFMPPTRDWVLLDIHSRRGSSAGKCIVSCALVPLSITRDAW